ncbi:protein SPT2 homolog [Agrilus planipennis]|uniref:Protein SPT2 homolog n=1 Tax=Agrilus planipennis TaxID=224129 RepID=A0A1W4XFY1_AGRPL|nr:protein SPT2 homolog [Agrilus planipennis]
MDFGTLLHTAKQNEHEKKEVRYYSTKFSPPKKEKKENRNLSVNVQKFLARKEEEERQKAEEVKKKREELLALRSQDKKATRRVNVMLKRTKSANQSVIQDAVDKDNTAVTIVGPSQPDEDDYGYVSQEASAFYNKMMEKYSKMPEEPKFPVTSKRVSCNLNSTKDRVRAALEKEKEEAMMPHRRKRKHGNENEKSDTSEDPESERKEGSGQPNKPKSKAMPPPMNFMEILKLAEQKQHEPIVIQPKPKEDEGPLMTKKQKREHEKERQRLEAKEARMKAEKTPPVDKNQKGKGIDNGFKVPKPSESHVNGYKAEKLTSNGNISVLPPKISKINARNSLEKPILKNDRVLEKKPEKNSTKYVDNSSSKEKRNTPLSSTDLKDKQKQNILIERQKLLDAKNRQKLEELKELQELEELREKQRQLQELERQKLQKLQKIKEKEKLIQNSQSTNNKVPSTLSKSPSSVNHTKQNKVTDVRDKTISSKLPAKAKDLQPKKFPPNDLKPKQVPLSDLKPKQFPPPDVKQRPPPIKKRRILDDDEEYDSEMDDFIDDGPEEEADYSKYIRDIFGYDKNKYKNIDDEDVEEASFHQQWKEEIISTKIGIMEDLEDMKMEEAEKRRKAMQKKNRKL